MTKITHEALEALIVELRCGDPSGAKCDKASDMLIKICRALRTGQLIHAVPSETCPSSNGCGYCTEHGCPRAQPSGDEVEGRVIAEVVAWLNNASIWLNGGECCGQKCSDGVCCAPACIWGDELKLLHSVATALETGEWRNAQSV